jgi:hypothetical protein
VGEWISLWLQLREAGHTDAYVSADQVAVVLWAMGLLCITDRTLTWVALLPQ